MAYRYLERASQIIKQSPRISHQTLSSIPVERRPKVWKPRYKRGNRLKWSNFPPLGHVDGQTPINIRTPKYPYYKYQEARPEYYPLSLFQLQNMIDMGVLDPKKPLDFGKIAVAGHIEYHLLKDMHGFQLTEEGIDVFHTPVFIEAQHVENENVIAAIERNGGTIITSFFDENALTCLREPSVFFSRGDPIPPRRLPPKELIEYFVDPSNRGYLCNDEDLTTARQQLADKFGYNVSGENHLEDMKKSPRQIFFHLDPGMIVNLHDNTVYKFNLNDEFQNLYKRDIQA